MTTPAAPTLTREEWRRLTLYAYGLTALAETVDDLVGDGPSDREERERLHGLTAAILSIAQSMQDVVSTANVWQAPISPQEETTLGVELTNMMKEGGLQP